jgi:hypothetical protein
MTVEPVLISMPFELNPSPMQIAWLPTMAGLDYERKARVMVVTICFKFLVHAVGERVQSKTCVIHCRVIDQADVQLTWSWNVSYVTMTFQNLNV